ncbi:hypothetical protein [Bartonella sp. CB178]|uniref:hypothetical protein n=1 Tax=Bartonella sp. CB178 TaxID=3112255 RepID=UPI00300DE3C0
MNFKHNEEPPIRIALWGTVIVSLFAALCVLLVCLYYFSSPFAYRATLTFSLSDPAGKSLPVDNQSNAVVFPFLSYASSNSLFLSNFYKKNFAENIYFSGDGELINLVFEAKTVADARYGVESWFAAFLEAIVKKNEKLLSMRQHIDQQYDDTTVPSIIQEFHSSIDSFIRRDVRQIELKDLYAQLTEATLKRIYLRNLSSTIRAIRKNGQSLLSLSFITNNSAISVLESKRNLLETQKAHMAAQLGWEHPQIKAMTAESEVISRQLNDKILQIVNQIHSDEIIAENFEIQLRKRIGFSAKDRYDSLNKMFDELENKIRETVDSRNKAINEDPSLQDIRVHVIVPTTLSPISFITLYGKIVGVLAGLLVFFGGLLLLQRCLGERRKQSKRIGSSIPLSKATDGLEACATIEGLSDFLKWSAPSVISIVGSEAARMAAKLSLHLIKECKTILLVNVSGQMIEKMIGPHRGLSDILTGHIQLQDVVYRDYDTGVDILPRGLTSPARAQEFAKNIPDILREFKKNYDFIILEIETEPKYGFEQFAELTDCYICDTVIDGQNWVMKMISKLPKIVYRVAAF